MYMLDTNILIYCMRHADSECARIVSEHLGIDVCISVVTYAELEYGIENSSDPARNRNAVNKILAGIKIIDFDMDAGTQFGRILAEQKKKGIVNNNQDRDKMIAAHARSLGCALVTDNTRDFVGIDGLQLCDWIKAG